jgi:signal transduction histidine kinase
MLPTSHPAPIHSAGEAVLVESAALADAFIDFSTAASRLESSYSELREEVTRLRATLAERNRTLKASLAENAHIKLALRQILDSLPCGVLVLNAGHRIELMNPEATRLLDVRNNSVRDLSDLPEACQSPIRNALATSPQDCQEDEFLLSGLSERRWLAVRVRQLPTASNDGDVVASRTDDGGGNVLILRDTTNQKRLEEEREAARNVVALAEMATVLAHEIRNPLASLELFASLIAQQNPGKEGPISHLQAGIRSLSSTANNVLLFHGGCPMQRVSIVLGESLRSAVDFMRPLAEQKWIHLSLHQETEGLTLLGDESGLRQVFLNLALNAFRHTAAGGNLRIASRPVDRQGAAWAQVEFCDDGCGIDPEALSRIFEPGFSATGQTPGLGLTVCRRIIEQHGGSLSAHSEISRGSTFSIEIPCE